MFQFALNMWKMKRVTEAWINRLVNKGFLTQEEADSILVSPQV